MVQLQEILRGELTTQYIHDEVLKSIHIFKNLR